MVQPLPDLVRAALERDAAQPALEFEGRWYSWGALRTASAQVHASLREAGIADGAPVALIARNRPEAIAAFLALLEAGRTIRMIYPFQSAEGIARILARLDVAGVVMHAADCAAEVRACAGAAGLGVVLLDGMSARAAPGLVAERTVENAGEPQIEILTSGTTGPPKHFPIPYAMLEAHFLSTALTRSQGDGLADLPPFLLYFPIGNISGIYTTLPTLLRGQRAVLLERFSVSAWHDYVVEHRPNHSGVPPSCVQQILDADIPDEDLASIKAMGIGAAPLDPTVQRRFEERYRIPILLSYGATEFAGPVAMMTAELHAEWAEAKHGSVGRAMPGVRLRVIDQASGAELPPGETGLLHVVSPRIGEDWIVTSDLAAIDADGFLYLRGRADGAIMRGGFKVLPETIEAALMLHPAISEAAVTGIADQRLGEVPVAALRLVPGAARPGEAELESHLRRQVLATHIPVRWLICDELPRTPSHKVDRTALRALFSKG